MTDVIHDDLPMIGTGCDRLQYRVKRLRQLTNSAATANPATIEVGQSTAINVTITPVMAGRPQPTGTVTLMEGSSTVGTGTLSGGSTSITVNGLAPGEYNIRTN